LEIALEILPQVLIDGIVLGFMYALIALGYTMVYGVLEFINFAHSEIFVLGAFVGAEIMLLLQDAGLLAAVHPAVVLLAVMAAATVVSGLSAMTLERVAYRPLYGAPRLVALISAIGASFFLQDALRFLESLWRNTFYLSYPSVEYLDRAVNLSETLVVPVKSLLVIATALLMLLGLYFFVNRTRVGTAIRAVAQDPETASLMGIAVNRVIALTFFVGGAMGGLAGVLFGLHYSLVNPYSGFIPGMKAFTAAVLGGIGNIPGAMLGGMVLGLLEAFAASYLSLLTDGAFGAEYKDVVAFLALILILIFRPKGLLGEKVREARA
jgi:branched-chain amino acid transport system permease protein